MNNAAEFNRISFLPSSHRDRRHKKIHQASTQNDFVGDEFNPGAIYLNLLNKSLHQSRHSTRFLFWL